MIPWCDTLGLPLFVANGVTGIRDTWGDLEIAANLRTAVDAGTRVGPRWVVAGNLVDAPHLWWPPSVVAGDPERARQVVDSLAAARAAFIKVYSLLDRETYRAILAGAREIGLPVAGHVPFSVTAREASQLGQASFEHLFGVMEGCSGADETVRLERQGWLAERAAGKHDVPNPFFDVGIYRNVLDTFEDATCTALLEELAERGTWQVPTLLANRIDAYLADSAFTADPRVEYMPASATEYWQGVAKAARVESWRDREVRLDYSGSSSRSWASCRSSQCRSSQGRTRPTRSCFRASACTTSSASWCRPGFSPAQALRSATYEPAVFLEATDSLGTVEPGKLADLVLLDADPGGHHQHQTDRRGVRERTLLRAAGAGRDAGAGTGGGRLTLRKATAGRPGPELRGWRRVRRDDHPLRSPRP